LPYIEQEGLYKGLYGWQYSIIRITPARSSNSSEDTGRPSFRLEAEPIYPGITGSETMVQWSMISGQKGNDYETSNQIDETHCKPKHGSEQIQDSLSSGIGTFSIDGGHLHNEPLDRSDR
jgi:hypothetical protein